MSQLTALPRPAAKATRPARPSRDTSDAPRLRVVQTKDTAEHSGVGFVLLCVFLLVGGLIALLLLNTNRAQESFAIEKLQSQSARLTDQQQQLTSEIDAQSAPQQLALQAQRMGLRPATSVRYVRKSDGKVLGVAKRSGKDSAFTVGTLPSTPASRAAGTAVSAASSGLLVTKPKPAKKPAKAKSTTPSKASTQPTKDTKKPAKADSKSAGKQSGTSKSTDKPKPPTASTKPSTTAR
jgi:hypothetical protein